MSERHRDHHYELRQPTPDDTPLIRALAELRLGHPSTDDTLLMRALAELSKVPQVRDGDRPHSEFVTSSADFLRPTPIFFSTAVALWTSGGVPREFVSRWREQAWEALRDPSSAHGVGGVFVAEAAHQPRSSRWLYRGTGNDHVGPTVDLTPWSLNPLVALVAAEIRGDGGPPTVLRLAPGALCANLSLACDLPEESRLAVVTGEEVVTLGKFKRTGDRSSEAGVRIVDLAPTSQKL